MQRLNHYTLSSSLGQHMQPRPFPRSPVPSGWCCVFLLHYGPDVFQSSLSKTQRGYQDCGPRGSPRSNHIEYSTRRHASWPPSWRRRRRRRRHYHLWSPGRPMAIRCPELRGPCWCRVITDGASSSIAALRGSGDSEGSDEHYEPIEGRTEHDVGWMYLGAAHIVGTYDSLGQELDTKDGWQLVYSRPSLESRPV
jgi:hypothetical protein